MVNTLIWDQNGGLEREEHGDIQSCVREWQGTGVSLEGCGEPVVVRDQSWSWLGVRRIGWKAVQKVANRQANPADINKTNTLLVCR